jgi:hypothetical protein
MKTPDIIIAIDPDVEKSGVATFSPATLGLFAHSLTLPELIDYIRTKHSALAETAYPLLVVIEAGLMNGSNHHLKSKGQYHAAKIGEHVGRNHEISMQIGKFCEHYQIPYEFKRPLKKCWKGKDGKITKEELDMLLEGSGITPIGRCNQEMRDAVLLALDKSGIPLIMKRKR